MARPTKELHKTTIQNAKPAQSDYKLMDGNTLDKLRRLIKATMGYCIKLGIIVKKC